MLSTETSKRRSARISLDHFRQVDRLSQARIWLSAVASIASIAWLSGFGLGFSDQSGGSRRLEALATHGPLAKPHAWLESSCDSCHVPFTPMDSNAWSARLVSDPKASDARCSSCHESVGEHQSGVKSEDVASCASCHRDHQGREVSLVSMPDRNCTRCHSEAEKHRKPGQRPSIANSVTSFDAERSHHPEFALFRDGPPKDPGRLKFNHGLHMASGFNSEPGGRPIKTLGDLPELDRETYRGPGQADRDPVQLRCDSCHRGEGDLRAKPTRAGTEGASMRPIRFERDCRACHSLDFDPELPAIRHGLQPDLMNEALWQSYAAKQVRGRLATGEDWASTRPVPGRGGRTEDRGEIDGEVARAVRILSGEKRCGECHSFDGPDGQAVPGLSAATRISPTGIPDRWLRLATFDHSKHRTARCVDCHARAYPDSPDASRSAVDVLIPSIATCQSCHSAKLPAPIRASNGCVECHPYHNGESSMKQATAVASFKAPDPDAQHSSKAIIRWIMAGKADGSRADRGLADVPGGEGRP